MIEFDNFKSWFTIEKEYKTKYKKKLQFDDDHLWLQDQKIFSCAFFFYYTYFHFGTAFLMKEAKILKISKNNNVFVLIEYLESLHETMILFYEEKYFPLINDLQIQNIIKDYAPLTVDAVKRYILSKNSDLHIKVKVVAYMIVIRYDFSRKVVFIEHFGSEYFSLLFGDAFTELFNFIELYNKSLYVHLAEIKYFISKSFHSIGYFENESPDMYDFEDDSIGKPDLHYIVNNFYNKDELYALMHLSEIPWKYVIFLNGELQIYHPRHPNGEGKYKPFYYKTQKSIKAFNQIKDYIINKLPPIKAKFNDDDVIISIDESCVDSISDSLDILKRHVEHTICSENDSNKVRSLFYKKDYSNDDIRKYIEKKKSVFLNTLCSHHLVDYKIHYCLESRINTEMIKYEEDAFIFTIASKNNEVLLAYENTETNRATYLFRCERSKIELAIEKICEFFSSGLINKRERVYRIVAHANDSGLKRLFKVSHSDSNWESQIKEQIDNLSFASSAC